MKKYLFILTLLSLSVLVNAQTDEKWFGILKSSDGSSDEITISISNNNHESRIYLFFNQEPPINIQSKNILSDKNDISFIIPEMQIYFEGKVNQTSNELLGQFVLRGRPFDISLSKHKDKSIVSKTPFKPEVLPGLSAEAITPDPEMKRPIAKSNSLFTEELTWIEIRDAVREGKTTIIIATGGIEQNGAFTATGKHNYVLRGVVDSIAHKLGNALIAPIVPFVPEGNHSPATSHMKYPGTISLKEDTYEKLLKDIANSYKASGFKTIIFIGDSGGNQWGMFMAAKELNSEWQNECKAIYINEYYDNYRVAQWLKEQGIREVDMKVHDSFQYTSQIMALNPTYVRMNQRIKNGDFSINGVNLLPVDKTIELGKRLCSYQADITVEAIKKALGY